MDVKPLRSAALFGALVAACGLDVVGAATAEAPAQEDAAAGPVSTPAPPDASADGGDGSVSVAPEPPDPKKVTVSHAIGKDKKVYAFDLGTKAFTELPSAGCPSGEETAVASDGTVYVTSSDNQKLLRLTATGCTLIKDASSFPYALGVAPAGTLSPTEDVLVGYMGAGDYVRVDTTTGAVTVIKAGALGALRPSGDVTAMGLRGFLAAATGTGSCPSGGDCIVEVDLKTGVPIALLSQLTGFGVYGIAHGGGQLLLYANGQVFQYDPTTKTLGASLGNMPSGASFSGAGAPPFPKP